MDLESLTIKTNFFRSKMGALLNSRKAKRVISDFNEFLIRPISDTGDDYGKRALVSYIVYHLIPPSGKRDTSNFSNAGIAQYIPRALNELGYSVDIVNFDNQQFVPRKKYDLFIGHGGTNYESIEKKLDPRCTKIYFSTGIYWEEWNRVEDERRMALQRRKGILLPSDRSIERDEEYANAHADGIICLGNDHAKQTYHKFPRVINVNNAVYPDSYSVSLKNFENGRHNFLFFNGPGNVHKGLDLLLDVFTQIPHQHLYIRQALEPGFFQLYKKELTEYPNIHLVPFLKKPSREFFSLMDTSNFVISPTCAEGQPGSIIECMAHGLIPLLSKEANIDTKDFGILLKENSIDEILCVVEEVSQKPIGWYQARAAMTMKEVHNYYSPEQFLENMKNAVQTIVQKKITVTTEGLSESDLPL
jgi:glycosyltransferase involved in cell wall biosynthesis